MTDPRLREPSDDEGDEFVVTRAESVRPSDFDESTRERPVEHDVREQIGFALPLGDASKHASQKAPHAFPELGGAHVIGGKERAPSPAPMSLGCAQNVDFLQSLDLRGGAPFTNPSLPEFVVQCGFETRPEATRSRGEHGVELLQSPQVVLDTIEHEGV